MAAIQRREGKWRESIASYEKAASLDPRNPILLENFAMDYLAIRDYPAAAKVLDRAVAAAPDSFTIRALRTRVEFESKGNLRPTQELLATMPENVDPNGTITLTRYNYKMYERKFDEVLGILDRTPAQTSRGETNAPIPKSFLKATVYALQKEAAKAKANYEEALVIAERAVQESPQDGSPACLARADLRRPRPLCGSDGGRQARGRIASGSDRRLRRSDPRDQPGANRDGMWR